VIPNKAEITTAKPLTTTDAAPLDEGEGEGEPEGAGAGADPPAAETVPVVIILGAGAVPVGIAKPVMEPEKGPAALVAAAPTPLKPGTGTPGAVPLVAMAAALKAL